MTGIPGHGGGKRFSVEQELVAAATRGAIKQLDLTQLKGKKVNLYVNAIGDSGAGNLLGGRFSIASQLRGDYIHSPVTEEKSTFPRYQSTTTSNNQTSSRDSSTVSSDSGSSSSNDSTTVGGISEGSTDSTVSGNSSTTSSSNNSSSTTSSNVTTTDSVLSVPDSTRTRQKGSGSFAQLGVEYRGLGAYHNSEEIVSNDLQYLSALLQTYLFLQGVHIVPPSEAEVDVYVTVDVFGTVRTRIEWFLANNEILKAKASMEVMAVDHLTGELLMAPQSVNAESEYNEQYILWAGPIIIKKTLNKSEPLLSDFTDLSGVGVPITPTSQHLPIPYPFSDEVEEMMEKEDKSDSL